MKRNYFVFILIILFLGCLFLERSTFAQGVADDTRLKSLSERLVEFILSILEPEPKKIDEALVRDHI